MCVSMHVCCMCSVHACMHVRMPVGVGVEEHDCGESVEAASLVDEHLLGIGLG